MTHLILPIMFELALKPNGTVVPGSGTERACNNAIAEARVTPSATILLTAGTPPDPKWNGQKMTDICRQYIVTQMTSVQVEYEPAPTFNTEGEVQALYSYLNRMATVTTVTVHVKWWHAPRVWLLLQRYRHTSRKKVPITVVPHCLPPGVSLTNRKAVLMEVLKFVYTLLLKWPKKLGPGA